MNFNPVPTELPIGGFQSDYDESRFVVLGVPFEETSTYRVGSKEAPIAIREAAANLETMNIFSIKDIAFSYIHDLGDLPSGTREEMFSSLREMLIQTKKDKKVPVVLGGEHTISVISSEVYKNSLFLMFDAHLDLRESYNNDTMSHACTARRMLDNINVDQLIIFGARAFSPEEYQFALSARLRFYLSSMEYQKMENELLSTIESLLPSYDGIYLSIDMDGFDPAFVPGIGNPEPLGVSPMNFLKTMSKLNKIVGIDITELCPAYDPTGVSQTVAARVAMNLMSM